MTDKSDENWIQTMKTAEEIRLFSSLYIKKAKKGAPYSAQEISALFCMALNQDISPLHLSQNMGISKSAVSRLVDHMSQKGVIEKVPCPEDGRSYCLRLTPKGADILKSVYFYYAEPVKLLEEALGKEQSQELLRLISLANANFKGRESK